MGLTVKSNPIIHTLVKAIFFYSPWHINQLKALKSPFYNFQTSSSFQIIKSITFSIKFAQKWGGNENKMEHGLFIYINNNNSTYQEKINLSQGKLHQI